MGSAPYAHLAFGVNVDDYDVAEALPWNEGYSSFKPCFEEWIIALANLVNPHSESDMSWSDWHEDPINKEKQSAFWRAKDEAQANCPIAIVCYDAENNHFLIAVNGTATSNSWDGPVTPETTVTAQQIESAKAFCEQHGIPFEDPKWLMIAQYS